MNVVGLGFILICLRQAVGTQLVNQGVETDLLSSECSFQNRSIHIHVYKGWPASVSCDSLYFNLEESAYFDDYSNGITAYCAVYTVDTKQLLYYDTADLHEYFTSLSYNIEYFNQSSPTEFRIKAGLTTNKSVCFETIVRLNSTRLPEMSCHDSLSNFTVTSKTATQERHLRLLCEPPTQDKYKLVKDFKYNVTWYRNCEETIPAEKHIQIKKFNFEHLAVYTCAVVHNGMKRYVNHYKTCIKGKKTGKKFPIKCSSMKFQTNIGSNLTVQCYWTHPVGRYKHYYAVNWEKLTNGNYSVVCSNGKTGSNHNSKKSCKFHIYDACFDETMKIDEVKELKKSIVMNLTLVNISPRDFGSYRVSLFETYDSRGANPQASTTTFSIEQNHKSRLRRQTGTVAFLVVLFIFFLFVAALIWWKFLYFRYFWRKRFEQFESDDKPYGAFLSYQFNSDMDKFAKEETREVVELVRDELEGSGYKVYDEFKNGNYEGYKSENAINAMNLCHRVVIILSSEYMKDHWSIFMLNKSFEEMIKRKTKLVFVLLPGVRDFIKQRSPSEGVACMVRSAIKSNSSIDWFNSKKYLKTFVMRLRLSMPNLRNKSGIRHTSTSSSLNFPQDGHLRDQLKRTMSCETGMTELSSPVSLDARFPEFELETRRDMSDRRIM